MNKSIAFVFSVILIVGCASTNITGFRDSAYKTTSYSKPAIDIRIDDLQHKVTIENLFVQDLLDRGIGAIKGTSLYPPTRKFTSEEWASALMNSSADSAVIISLKEGSTEDRQVWLIRVIGKDVGKVVWTGESKTSLLQGNILDGMNLGTMFKSISKNVVTRLIEDKVFLESALK